MITTNLCKFIELYHKQNNNLFPNKKSNIYAIPNKNINFDKNKNKLYLKNIINITKNNWLGIIDKNKLYLYYIERVDKNSLILRKQLVFIFSWMLWKKTIKYKHNYYINRLCKIKNPFPNIILHYY